MGLPLSCGVTSGRRSCARLQQARARSALSSRHDSAKPAGHRFLPWPNSEAVCPHNRLGAAGGAAVRAAAVLAVLLRRGAYCLPMPKSRGRKPKKNRAPANGAPKRLDALNTTPQEPPLSIRPPQEPPSPKIEQIARPASIRRAISTALFQQIRALTTVGLAAIAISQFAYAFKPSVTIEAGPVLDVRDPLATLIRITNSGRVPVRNVRFSCQILPQGTGTENIRPGQESVASLAAHASATRDCVARANRGLTSIQGLNPLTMGLDITVDFTWPLIPLADHETRHFSVRRDEDGRFILVPDTEK
jgi:hypothetical protein